MRYVLAVAFSVLLVLSASAAGEGDGNLESPVLLEKVLEKYEFRDWGGKCRTPYAVLHVGLGLRKALETNYSIVSAYGPEEAAGPMPFTYRQVLVAEAPEENSEGSTDANTKDSPMFSVRYYECRSVLDAHRLLCGGVMQTGAAPSPPNRCLEGVDVGDKCFTGWSKDIPATIYFARGNVAISVSSSVSVLEVAQQIDAWLSLSPALVQEAAVDEIEEETPFLAKHFEGSVGEEVLLMKGEADASLRCSITATGGTLMLTEGDRVVLVAQKAGEITVKAYDLDQGIVALRGTATVTIKEQPKE